MTNLTSMFDKWGAEIEAETSSPVKSGSLDALFDRWDEEYARENPGSGTNAMGLTSVTPDEQKLQSYVDYYNRTNPDKPITVEDIPDRSGVFGRASELAHGIGHAVVDQFPEDAARIWQGGDVKLNGDDWSQRMIDEQEKDRAGRVLSKQNILEDWSANALSQGPASVATSATVGTSGAMIGGAIGSVVPVVGTAIGSMVGAAVATGPAFYRMAKNQFLHEMLDVAQQNNIKLTEDEWAQIKADIDGEATEFGLWEAGPEAISQGLTAGLLRGVGGKVFSKIPGFGKITEGISKRAVTRVGAKLTAEIGEEEATEYVTYQGQEGIRKEVGLRKDAPSMREFIDTQAGPVAVGAVLQLGVHKAGSKTLDLLKGDTGAGAAPAAPGRRDARLVSLTGLEEDSRPTPAAPNAMGMDGEDDYYSEEAVNARYESGLREARDAGSPFPNAMDLMKMDMGDDSANVTGNGQGDGGGQMVMPDGVDIETLLSQWDTEMAQEAESLALQDQWDTEEAARVPNAMGITTADRHGAVLRQEPRLTSKGIPLDVALSHMSTQPAADSPEFDMTAMGIGQPEPYAVHPAPVQPGGYLPSEPTMTSQGQPLGEALVEDMGTESVQTEPTETDLKAHEAATSPANDRPQPTEKMKEAGNYRKGHVRALGMDISIENPAGSERSGTDKTGKPWSVQMQHHYGYIKGTEGKDKDHLDVFMKDGVEAQDMAEKPVYVVDQVNQDGSFDEHKILMGFDSAEDAEAGYLSNYEEGWQGMGAITEMGADEFKTWAKKPRKTKQPVGLGKIEQESPAEPELLEFDHGRVRNAYRHVSLNADQAARVEAGWLEESKAELRSMLENDAPEATREDIDAAVEQFGQDYLREREKVHAVRENSYSSAVTGRSKFNSKQAAHRSSALDKAENRFITWQKSAVSDIEGRFGVTKVREDEKAKSKARMEKADRLVREYEAKEREREKKLPIINVPDGAKHISSAEWNDTHKDYKSIVVSEGGYRYRSMMVQGGTTPVFLTDKKVVEKPGSASAQEKESVPVFDPEWTELDGQKILHIPGSKWAAVPNNGKKVSKRWTAFNVETREEGPQLTQQEVRSWLAGAANGEDVEKNSAVEVKNLPEEKPKPKVKTPQVEQVKSKGYPLPEGDFTQEDFRPFTKALGNGEVSADVFKAAYGKIVASEDAFKESLAKLNKKQILAFVSTLRYSMSDSKDLLIDAAYDGVLNRFTLGKPISFLVVGSAKDARAGAMREMVEATTDEELQKYAEDYQKRQERHKKQAEGQKKALENPETYDEFRFFVDHRGEKSLTPEQKIKWDELLAERIKDRKERQAAQKATVKAVTSEGVSLEYKGQTTHTKKGHDLFVVGIADRVDRSVFNELKDKAKQLGGYYSSFRASGAIPGFQFTTKETADKFLALQDGDVSKADVVEAKEEAAQDVAVSKLRNMADSIEEKAKESLSQDRKTHTARYARMASSAEADARTDIRLAATMRNIADAIESGAAKMLSGIKSKVQIEMLDGLARQAKWEYDRDNGMRYEESKETPPTPEHMSAAKFPGLDVDVREIYSLANDLDKIKGGKRLALQLRARAKRAKGKTSYQEGSYDFRNEDQLLRDAFKKGAGDGWRLHDRIKERDRLARMGITTEAELRVALREFLTYRGERLKADPVKAAERSLAGRKIDGYFPTPKATVEKMLAEANIEPGMSVLEPSAGKGNIADIIKEEHPNAEIEAVEPVPELRSILEAKGHSIVGRDFLEHEGEYDRIVMNPPFEKRQDVAHVRHAFKLLKPGGRLVAIMSEGPFFGQDKIATDFREWLDEVGWSEQLPEGSFKSSERPTGVSTRMVVIDKPDVSSSDTKETAVELQSDKEKSDGREEARPSNGQGVEDGKGSAAVSEPGGREGGPEDVRERASREVGADEEADTRGERVRSSENAIRDELRTVDGYFDVETATVDIARAFSPIPIEEFDAIIKELEDFNRDRRRQEHLNSLTKEEIDDPVIAHMMGRLDGKSLRDWDGLYNIVKKKFGPRFFRSQDRGGIGIDQLADEMNRAGLFDGDSDALAERLKESDGVLDRRANIKLSAVDGPVKGMNAKSIEVDLGRLQDAAKNALPLRVVQSVDDLPNHIKNEAKKSDIGYVEAANDGDTVYIVADNVPSNRRAVALWMHEQGVHTGLKELLGPLAYRRVLKQVFVSAGGKGSFLNLAERYGFDLNNRSDQLRAAEEYLATIAENVSEGQALAGKEVSVWRRVVKAIADWLRSLGVNLKLTDSEIAWIVNESIRATVHGERQTGTEAGMSPAVAFSQQGRGWDTPESAERQVQGDTETWSNTLDDFLAGKIHPRKRMTICSTSDVLQKLGAPDVPVTTTKGRLDKILDTKHGVSVDSIKSLPEHLAAPLAVFDSASMANSFLILTELNHNGSPVVVALHLDLSEGRLTMNEVASAYGKDGAYGFIKREFREGRVRYWDKKKYSEVQRMSGLQLPRAFELRSKKKILTERDVVKPHGIDVNFSLADSAPEGRRVSPQEAIRALRAAARGQAIDGQARPSRADADAARIVDADPSQVAQDVANGNIGFIDLTKTGDLSFLQEVASLPHWIAKRFPAFDRIYRRQLTRMDERAKMLKASLEEVEDFFADMNENEMSQLRDIIWRIDGKKLQGMNGDKFITVRDDNGRPVREGGRVELEMNPEYYEAFNAWVDRQNLAPKVKSALKALRVSLDRDFLRAYDAMREMSEIDDDTIKQFRTNINHVHNYFPHKRYGAYYVKGVGRNYVTTTTDGWGVFNAAGTLLEDFKTERAARAYLSENKEGAVYREHFDASASPLAKKKAAERIAELKREYGEDNIRWQFGKNDRLPDELYEYAIDTNAMEQIIMAAADKLDNREQADEIKRNMAQAVAETMKSRGWSGAAIGRKGVPGHEVEDIQRVVYDYKSGLSGWLTKMQASRDFTQLLGKVDAKKHPREYVYATNYVQNMLRNADKVDRAVGNIKALAFLWYLGFNLKTAALNLTQNVIVGVPRLGMDVKGSAFKYYKSAMDTLQEQTTGGDSSRLSQDEKRLLDELYREDVITEGFLNEIRGKVQGVSVASIGNKVLKGAGWPMAVAERFNRASLALAAYRAARDGNVKRNPTPMGYEAAKAFAEDIVRDAHFVYGKTNLPQPLRNSTIGRGMNPAYTFRTFSHNVLSIWNWMLTTQGAEGWKAFAKSMLGTMAVGGFTALPFYATLMHLFQWIMDDDDDWTEEIRKQLPEGEILRDMVTYGLPAATGFSLGGSVGLETPIISRLDPGATIEESVADNIGDIFGIPYDLFLRKPSRIMKALKSGDEWRAFEEAAPTIIKNGMAGYRMWTDGQRSFSGKPINEPGKLGPKKLTEAEAWGKMAGFQPVSSRKSFDQYQARTVSKQVRSNKASEIANRLSAALRAKDQDEAQDVLRDLQAWNEAARQEKKLWMIITNKDIVSRVKSRSKPQGVSPRDALRILRQREAD
jgi:Methyltransferase small domain.